MAINYYGSCSGTSATKYDLWINIAQNSQSVDDNQSNVTVKFYVKRNDGYSASAYNLNEEENSVKLTVNGNVLVSENIEIDTRNNVSFLLASWTGNLTHNADGKLSVETSEGTKELACDSVILSVGYNEENSLYHEVEFDVPEIYLLGDAKKVANIMYAIWDAFEVANHI